VCAGKFANHPQCGIQTTLPSSGEATLPSRSPRRSWMGCTQSSSPADDPLRSPTPVRDSFSCQNHLGLLSLPHPPPPAVLPSHSLVRSPMRERDRSATGPAHLHHRRIHHRESEVGDANNVGRSSDRALRQIPMGRAPMVGRHRGGSDRWVGAWVELPGPARCHSRRQ
jgi:hypothetical protein